MLDRSSAPLDVLDLRKQLAAREIGFPAAVQPALDLLERVKDRRPPDVSATAIREAYLRDASDDEVRDLLLDDVAAQRLRSEHGQAVIAAAAAVLAAVLDHADDVFVLLRAQAHEAIAKLEKIAAIPASETVDGLLRSGRTEDATLLADAGAVAADFDACVRLRDQYLIRGGPQATSANSFYCGVWRDPVEAAKHARGATPADQYLAGLREGLSLWFPTGAEAREAAQGFADAAAEAAEKRRKAEHGVGSSFAAW